MIGRERRTDGFYGFYTGTEFHAHEYLGAHVTDDGVVFRVFAPAASGIAVIGEFNEWNGDHHA